MQTIHDLSKRDACSALEFIGDCLKCTNLDQFRNLVVYLRTLLAFEMATCLMSRKDEQGNLESLDILNVNYPEEWIKIYVANDYKKIDPVLKANFETYRLQFWADTYRRFPPPKKFRSDAEDFGLREGYTLGLRNCSGDEGSLFSIAGSSLESGTRTETLLAVTIPHLHQAFCRVNKYTQKRLASLISAREKEILKWIAQGKTYWEISVILHISERTVHFHAQNIMRKLNASSRVHALAIALEEKILGIP